MPLDALPLHEVHEGARVAGHHRRAGWRLPRPSRRVRREHQLPKGKHLESEHVEGCLWELLHAELLRKGGGETGAGGASVVNEAALLETVV